jgi:hypothetical protein
MIGSDADAVVALASQFWHGCRICINDMEIVNGVNRIGKPNCRGSKVFFFFVFLFIPGQ